MIKIAIADDHPVVRKGLTGLLAAEDDLTIVAETGDGLKVADLVEQHRPDVLLLDIMLPGLNGLEVTRQVTRRNPSVRVLMVSMHANEAYVLEALRNGAAGYVLKNVSADELTRAIREVAAGRRYLCPPFSDRAVQAYVEQVGDDRTADPYDSLTEREREVLHLAAEGASAADIGQRLFVSPRTVEVHRANLMKKLGLTNQTDLVRYAIRRGLISAEG